MVTTTTMPEQTGEPSKEPEQSGSRSTTDPDARPDAKTDAKAEAKKAAKSDFDEHMDGEGENIGDRQRAFHDVLTMYGSRTSGVVVVGDGVQIGNIVGGDSFHADEKSGPVLNAVAARTVSETARVYVEPTGFDAIAEVITKHRFVLLGTCPRWGNTATAIHLLTRAKAIYELRYAGHLSELPVDQMPHGAGFILDAADARTLATLRPQNLADLEDRLRDADVRLVVITDAGLAAEHGARPVWRAVAAPPDAYELTLRHLDHRLGSREQAMELIDQAGVAAELKDMAAGAFDVHRLAELASDLAEAARGYGTLADATERFAARADHAVEEWFDEQLTDGRDRAFVLALAVLNGMSFDAVSRAANLLIRQWPSEAPPGMSGARRASRRERLRVARARITMESRPTRYGSATLEIASFADATYPQRILRHYWHEHDYDRDLLLDWLREVAEDVELAVAIRAAGAVGYLGTFAFDTVRRDVIVPWMGSGKGNERELAVAALAMPARTPGTAARTVRLVADWAGRDGESARITAARALGTSVGAVLDPGPDALLAQLAEGADGHLATALGDSVGELVAAAEHDRRMELLGLLDSWSAEGRKGRQTAGVLGFLWAAWTQWTETEDGPSWPLLLRLAERDVAAAAVIARLWARSLVAAGADSGVRVALRSWAQAAERDPGQRGAFVRLFSAVPATQRQADLLKHHAENLRTRKPASPDTARKLLDALAKGR